MNALTSAWLHEVIGDHITITPNDINFEARENQWSFGVTPEDAAIMTIGDIEDFISAVVRARSDSLKIDGTPCGMMTFYCWFDEMASQLRFSIVSAKRDALPFACDPVDTSLPSIASAFLSSRFHDGIPWSDLHAVEAPTVNLGRAGVPVWSASIP